MADGRLNGKEVAATAARLISEKAEGHVGS